MNHVRTKTTKRWWWWVALVCTIVVVVIISSSYFWRIKLDGPNDWPYPICRSLLLVGNSELIMVYYGPINPSDMHSKMKLFVYQFNLFLLLIILLPIVFYPMLPFVKKRFRRKHGLCVKCAYDLTGNESGTCPECGMEIKA